MPSPKKTVTGARRAADSKTRVSTKGSARSMRKRLAGELPGADVEMAIFLLMLTRLSRINETITGAINADFSAADRLVLSVLLMEAPPYRLSPSALADHIVQTPSGMTKTLQRLEALGLVRRIRDESDRRALLVELTPAGVEATQKMYYGAIERYSDILIEVSTGERKDTMKVLRSLLNNFESAAGVRDTQEWLN